MKDFDLRTRHFISNTTMDPLLSLLMCNMGHARPGAIVCDPFVGSGEFALKNMPRIVCEVAKTVFSVSVLGGETPVSVAHAKQRSE